MAQASVGGQAVEQTLRLARDAIERDVARYRVIVFAAVVVVTGVLNLTGFSPTWLPTAIFAGAIVYALVIRALVARPVIAPWLPMMSLVADLALCVAPFLVVSATVAPEKRITESLFAVYIMGPAFLLTLFINTLRNSVVTSIAGGAAALVLYELAISRVVGFHPAQVSVGVMMVLAGIIGAAAARQARKSLHDFARLELLRRYLPPEAVERVMREDLDRALELGGRLVTVTLLAADLRGFTSMSEKLEPSEVMAQLNAYHGVMIDVIERHGGAIDKFIGDGTLVVFGLRGGEREAAKAAVTCAEAMVAALDEHNAARAEAGSPALAMGIGVHTGPVIAGNLGVPGRRLEFTVIGDAVNTVSRLEGQTKTAGCSVIVSAATVDLLEDRERLRELAPVSLRGRQSTVRVYAL
jgi:adenylate cyclase